MTKKEGSSAPSLQGVSRRAFRVLAPLVMFLVCVVLQGGCTCTVDGPPPPRGLIVCRPQHPTRPTVTKTSAEGEVETVAAGSAPGSFSIHLTSRNAR
jgi:hypothetical protein